VCFFYQTPIPTLMLGSDCSEVGGGGGGGKRGNS
jgi:hypothetical protein